ncbi:MAG: Inorganic pyrophosphatase [Ignavibacteria bacterium]|nr:Inorganic pyrophosphatase [Ignavibacteria bacterium]
MNQLENNAFFWQKLDSIYFASSIVITQPQGSMHSTFTNLVYPVDYGYLNDTLSQDLLGIAIYKGKGSAYSVEAILVAADILKKDIEVKLLVGCSQEEVDKILRFVNQTEYQKTIIVRRGNDVPSWSNPDL